MKKSGITLALAILSASALPSTAHAAKAWAYAIPVVCGVASEADTAAVPGRYATAITVTNLDRRDSRIRARALLTVPERAESESILREIAGASAVTADCASLGTLFVFDVDLNAGDYAQGIVLLESRLPLQVQVQTTVLADTGGPAISHQVIEGQRVSRRGNVDKVSSESVEICHIPPGNPAAQHTIIVGASAVDAHVGNHGGDYLGPCESD